MIVLWSPEADKQLTAQVNYIIERDAPRAAAKVFQRVRDYVENTLTIVPRNARYLIEHDCWETWIPRTSLVIRYRFDDEKLIVVTLFHVRQDRENID